MTENSTHEQNGTVRRSSEESAKNFAEGFKRFLDPNQMIEENGVTKLNLHTPSRAGNGEPNPEGSLELFD